MKVNYKIKNVVCTLSLLVLEFFQQLSFEPGDDETHYLLPDDVAEAVSYVLNSRNRIVIDEINLNPLSKVVKFKKTKD